MNRLLQHLAAGLSDPEGGELSDGQLLEAYLAHRQSGPFAALVRRHGPMVWGVCRRLLPCHQDAEDAFQATFLVLVRKAATIVPRNMVGNWLYGVAYQTALKARALAARRQARERQGADMPEPESRPQDAAPDLQPLLDQELARLPARYRSVLVLCDLEGKTRREAARQLGVPDGTVAGWLARARGMLAKRLTRRGVTLSAASFAAAMSETTAPATVPAHLLTSTIEAAAVFAAMPVTTGALPAPVVALTEGVLRTMLLNKLKAAFIVVAAAAVLTTGLGGLAFRASAGQEPKQRPPGAPPAAQGRDAAGPDEELRQLRAEIAKLRTELEALRKQVPLSSTNVLRAESADRPAKAEDADAKLVVRVYPIRDLLDESVDAPPAASITQVLTSAVQPETWTPLGGAGTMEYFAPGRSLVSAGSTCSAT